ncbi:helix-turn-helix domain-containing protein [Nocardia terpenica]|uniref:Helix-turn-helix domain-containing protein n=2 Tax=Nocardia terpenica TaxID=455432 RepID=A0A6G9Z2U8_9NOCA|nr:helix-turn-helix domain-containing protein [Nocardia terpenica]
MTVSANAIYAASCCNSLFMNATLEYMPGHRLTYRDRRAITAGLSAGLTYAEIARQLDRPTSTVTREINRNGGPAGYRAEPAQRSTDERARRRPLPPRADAPIPSDPDVVLEVGEQLIDMIVAVGLTRTAARVFVHLCLSDDDSRTAAQLVQSLRVSPASVSKAIGYLEESGMVRRERDGRRERYSIGPDIWSRVSMISARKDRAAADLAWRAAGILGTDTPAGSRLADMAWCFETVLRIETLGAELLAAFPHPPAQMRPDELIPEHALSGSVPCPSCGTAVPLPVPVG